MISRFFKWLFQGNKNVCVIKDKYKYYVHFAYIRRFYSRKFEKKIYSLEWNYKMLNIFAD